MANATYPTVISKQSPLIVRVSETMLLVDSTSYSAKIKLGVQHRGFYIYVSGLGTPIYTYETDGDGKSEEGGSNSDLHAYLTDLAREWLDNLQDSFAESSEVSLTEAIQALMYQLHLDVTGDSPDSIPEDILKFVDTESNTLQEQLDVIKTELSTKLDSIVSQLNLIKEELVTMDNSISGIKSDFDTLNGKVETLNTNVSSIATNVSALDDNLNGVNGSVPTLITSLESSISSHASSIGESVNNAITHIDEGLVEIQELIGSEEGSTVFGKLGEVIADTDYISSWYVKNPAGSSGVLSDIGGNASRSVSQLETLIKTIGSKPNDDYTVIKQLDSIGTSVGNGASAGSIDALTSTINYISGCVTCPGNHRLSDIIGAKQRYPDPSGAYDDVSLSDAVSNILDKMNAFMLTGNTHSATQALQWTDAGWAVRAVVV